jgi:hypothetical protein
MLAVLLRMRERAHERNAAVATSPVNSIQNSPEQTVDMVMANDADGSLTHQKRQFALPADPGLRTRIILNKLLESYTDPESPHPLSEADGVQQIFLLPLPNNTLGTHPEEAPQLAVVNLSKKFVDAHPSGIETETLTILSLCATLHESMPRVQQVRFLVEGQPRDTLAGHIDLTRTYLAREAEQK